MGSLVKSKFVNQIGCGGKEFQLEIKKYARKVFYDNLWNVEPDLVNMRGAVFINNTQVVHPMVKCFNYGENGTGLNLGDVKVKLYKKLNGFMVNVTMVPSVGVIISTTGDAMILGNQTENKHLRMAVEMIEKFDIISNYLSLYEERVSNIQDIFTVSYEVCHPDDPHIIPEHFGIHILTSQMNGSHPKQENIHLYKGTIGFSAALDLLKSVTHEGWMVYSLDDKLLMKLKSPYYLAKKWIQRGGSKRVWSPDYKRILDEEYYPVVIRIRELYSKDVWDSMDEQSKSIAFADALKFCTESLRHAS